MSRITVQMYLHDVPEEFGGATTFIGKDKDYPCQQKCGSALIFTQNLVHEGSLVKEGAVDPAGSLVEEALHFESAQNLGMGDFSVRN